MASELLSSITGGTGGGAYPFPTLPTPLNNDGYISQTSNIIPHGGTLVDNIQIPTAFATGATGDYVGKLGETTVWTVNATDVNAAADGFWGIQACWYDSVNDRLYVVAIDTGTTPDTYYLAYITVETGAITNVGNAQFGTQPTDINGDLTVNIQRGAIDSGNFTVRTSDRTIVINESTGAEVSNAAETNVLAGFEVGTYSTLDATIMVHKNALDSTETSGAFELIKSGNMIRVPSPMPLFSNVLNGTEENFLPWGDKVKVLKNTNTATTGGVIRTFNRAQFDQWLQDVARFGGVS